jgi:adenylate kinase
MEALQASSGDKLFMRQFLMKAIIPVLTEGMCDVWRVKPIDPVDYLAEYIFRKSNEICKQ